jgi:hypothetical protein
MNIKVLTFSFFLLTFSFLLFPSPAAGMEGAWPAGGGPECQRSLAFGGASPHSGAKAPFRFNQPE